mgnify:CR=1 FL=1
MSTTFTNSMFNQLKSALATGNEQSSNGKYKDILKLTVGNVYTVRLLPNVEQPEKTFFHYYTQGWNSFSTGRYTSTISPQTWGDKDIISETRYRLLQHGTDEEKEKAETLIRRESWLANVYVVNDPVNPDNNGKTKLLRFGKQLYKIVMDAIEGEDSDEFGAKIFDLTKNGCNLKIKVERQGDFPTYVSSRFAAPSKVTGLADSDVDSVYESITDLETVFPARSDEEMKAMLAEHFFCKSDDDTGFESTTEEVSNESSTTSDSDDVDPLDDDKVKELLDGLGDE